MFLKTIERWIKKRILNVYIKTHETKQRDFPFTADAKTKILLIRLNKVGDALVTTPFIMLLKKHTGAELTILADKKNQAVFKGHEAVSELIVFDKNPEKARAIKKLLNAKQFDIVIDLHDDVSNTVSVLVGSLNSKVKVALEKSTSPLYTHVVKKKDPAVTHIVERIAGLGSLFGFNPQSTELHINMNIPADADTKIHDYILQKCGKDKLIVAVNITAGNMARYWGTDRFYKLVKALSQQHVEVLLLSGPHDQKYSHAIIQDHSRIIDTPSFSEFAAVFKHIDLLFSPDTAPVHLASMFNKPVFGLYVHFNTDEVIWSPYHCDFDAVITKEPNLDNISFDTVINKFQPFLEKYINEKKRT